MELSQKRDQYLKILQDLDARATEANLLQNKSDFTVAASIQSIDNTVINIPPIDINIAIRVTVAEAIFKFINNDGTILFDEMEAKQEAAKSMLSVQEEEIRQLDDAIHREEAEMLRHQLESKKKRRKN